MLCGSVSSEEVTIVFSGKAVALTVENKNGIDSRKEGWEYLYVSSSNEGEGGDDCLVRGTSIPGKAVMDMMDRFMTEYICFVTVHTAGVIRMNE